MPTKNCAMDGALLCWRRFDGKAPSGPMARSALEIERYCAGSLGWGKAYSGLKPLLDCLVAPSARNPDGVGVIQDDSPILMPKGPRVHQFAVKRGAGCTVVRIYAVN